MSHHPEDNIRLVVSRCQHCNGNIEFDVNELNGRETATVVCPHCHLETVIFETSIETPPKLPPIPPILPHSPIWFGNKEDVIKIQMNSGEYHDVHSVRLYDESALRELGMRRASALQKMGGVSTGLGTIGSFSWVVGVSAILSVVESSLSKKSFADGFGLLQTVVKDEEKLRESGKFFPVGRIQFVAYPSPGLWRVVDGREAFVHSGDEFLSLMDGDGCAAAIRWSAIERWSYEVKKSKPSGSHLNI